MVTYKVLLCDNTGRWDEHKLELKAGQSVIDAFDTVRHFCEHYMADDRASVAHASDVHFTLYVREAGFNNSYVVKSGTCDAIYR